MNAHEALEHTMNREMSPRVLSRTGGVLYLIIIAIGVFGEMFVRRRLVVPGDAAGTAAKIQSMESLWRFGIAAEYLLLICGISLAAIFLILLRPVSRDLAWLAVFFNVVSLTVEAVAGLNLIAALFPLGNANYLSAFEPEQLHTLARLAIRTHGHGFSVALLFFGCFCVVAGYLIFRSGYLPKALGILMQLAGVSYLTHSFALILAPTLADRIFAVIFIVPFVAETSLAFWLLVKGVDVQRWSERVRAAQQQLPTRF